MTSSNYSILTPQVDFGKKQPRKRRVSKLLQVCKRYNRPVRKIVNPGFASEYQPEFVEAFREICSIYCESEFRFPEKQVLILMLDNHIYPCRADKFNESTVVRMSGGIFIKKVSATQKRS